MNFKEMQQLKEVAERAKAEMDRANALQKQLDVFNEAKLTYNPIETGPGGEIKLRKEFQLEGPEKFIEAERGRLAQEQAGSADTLQQQIAQQQAQQRAQMASRGGLRGANQALLSRFSMRDALMGQQQLGREAASQRGELEAKGFGLSQAIKEKNLQNLMSSVKDVEQFNLERWKKAKEVEASKAQAQATRESAPKGSCWIISEFSKHVKLPRDQGKLLTKMKIHFAMNNLRLSVFYIRKCGTLIEKMNASNFDWVGFKWFNDSLVSLLRSGEYEAASALFKSTVLNLIQEFWPECSDRAYLKAIEEQNKKVEEMAAISNNQENETIDFECLSNLPETSFEGRT